MKKLIVTQSDGNSYAKFRKLLLIMKLTAILLMVVCLQVSAKSYSQNEITLSVKNVELKSLFRLIQKNAGYRFLYEDRQLPANVLVDVHVQNESIQNLMDKILQNTGLQYKVINNNLVLLTTVSKPALNVFIVKGRILDETGNGLSGVSIRVKGGKTGVFTDENGYFQLEVPGAATIEISFIGYQTVEMAVTENQEINLQLEPGDQNLDEVVVVGFGIQKKVNLTGAVDMVTAKQLESRPLTNLGAGLQGLIPNLNITTSNGRATTNPSFNIRGFTSINGGEPLIVVDNVPFTMDEVARLNPNDIETVSVLKDAASAAIYGARASFGVVLITTKSAKGSKLNVSVNSMAAYRTLGKLPALVTDPYQAMDFKHQAAVPLYNLYPEAAREYAKQRSEDPSLPSAILNPTNPDNWLYYGSTDWLKEAYHNTAPTYNTNISVSKRSDKISYYLSGDYYRQEGMLKYGNDVYNRYNARGKVDFDVTSWLKLSNNTLLTSWDYDAPVYLDGDFFWNVNRTNSLDVPFNPDGSWTSAGASVLGSLQQGGRKNTRLNDFQTTFSAKAALIKEVLNINVDATFRRGASLTRSFDVPVPYKTGPNNPIQYTFANTWAQNENNTSRYNVLNVYTDFSKDFGAHSLQALVGYNQEYRFDNYFSVRRNGLISNDLPSIGLSTGALVPPVERITDWAVQGLFYRLGYNYDGRYLLELNGRNDGSSRFPQNKRWGFFPSVSAGWVVSEEGFFEPVKNSIALNVFKIRGSYGSLGNQTFVDPNRDPYRETYPYIPIMNNGQVPIILGNTRPLAVYAPGAVSDNFSWEKINTVNFGVDLAFLSNRLELNFDKYTRYTKDMLIPGKALPAVFGTSVPRENAGDLKTKGWELRLGWRDRGVLAGSPFYYGIAFNLADSRAWITRFDNPTRSLGGNFEGYYVGREIGEIWGAEIEGFFRDEADMANHPNQRAMGTDDQSYNFFVGDPKFADRNKDGVVDKGNNTVDNPGDMYIVGNSWSRFPYGVDLTAGWKGFDLRIFLQGIGKRDWYPGASNVYFWGIFAQPWTNVTVQNLDHWTPENPNAYFPAIRAYTAEDSYQQLSIPNKRYMQNAAYMRVKNITVGYTLPASLLKRAGLEKLRFYFSAENIFEISHIKVKLDPESLGSGNRPQAAYPFQRTYSFGLNLNF